MTIFSEMQGRREAYLSRFLVRFHPNQNGCWIWDGASDKAGYGRFHFGVRSSMAHRASWMLYRGEIPAGMHVCHSCDTPACVNPDHLFLGTDADNAADRSVKLRSHRPSGPRGFLRKLTEDDVRLIRSDNRSCGELARLLGVNGDTISRARLGRTWKHVDSKFPPPIKKSKSFSATGAGYILCRRDSKSGSLIGYLRQTEFASIEDAEAEAARRADAAGHEFVVFRQVLSAVPADQAEAV